MSATTHTLEFYFQKHFQNVIDTPGRAQADKDVAQKMIDDKEHLDWELIDNIFYVTAWEDDGLGGRDVFECDVSLKKILDLMDDQTDAFRTYNE